MSIIHKYIDKQGERDIMELSSNNVIQFPKKIMNHTTVPKSIKEIEENMDMLKQVHIQEAIETVVPMLFDNLSIVGFQARNEEEEEEYIKYGAMIVESIRSFLSVYHEIHHPFQLIAENIFVDNEEDGGLMVSENIKIVIGSKTPTVE
jgi:hypothetical protein